jgi:hypothetical protein
LFTNTVEVHSEVALSRLSNVDKGTAEELGLQPKDPSRLAVDNNSTYMAIRDGILPLLTLDTLLHASDPSSPAQLLVAHLHRPNHLLKNHLVCAPSWPLRRVSLSGLQYFVKERAWYKVLKDAKAVYDKVLTIAKMPDTKLDDKPAEVASALGRLWLLNDTRKVGSGAVHNISQLVFMLQAMLQVLFVSFGSNFLAPTTSYRVTVLLLRRLFMLLA